MKCEHADLNKVLSSLCIIYVLPTHTVSYENHLQKKGKANTSFIKGTLILAKSEKINMKRQ